MKVMAMKSKHQLNASRTLLWKKVHINLHRPLTQTPHTMGIVFIIYQWVKGIGRELKS